MNKKRVLFTSILLLLVVFVSGVSYLKFKNNNTNSDNVEDSGTADNVVTSIKDALSKKVTLVCEFKDDSGSSVKSYIKNGAIRIMTNNNAESGAGEIIIKDKKMYMWDVKTKQGFMYDVPEESENDTASITNGEIVKSESYLNMIDKYKDSCKVSSVEDSYFDLPSDIKFQDMAKFLEDIKSQMPQGFELPNQ